MRREVIFAGTCLFRKSQTCIDQGEACPRWREQQGKGNELGASERQTEDWVPGEKGVRVRVIGDEVHCPGPLGLVTQQLASHFTTAGSDKASLESRWENYLFVYLFIYLFICLSIYSFI